MKQYKKAFAIIAIALCAGIGAQAQEENTNTRLVDQLKKGTAPGSQFSSERTIVLPVTNEGKDAKTKESLITQIRKGTAPNMQFKPGGNANARVAGPKPVLQRNAAALAKQKELPSAKLSPKPAAKPVAAQPVIPSQEELASPAPAAKP